MQTPVLFFGVALLCAVPLAASGGQVMQHAKGTFDVKTVAVDSPELARAAGLGNMTLDKTWHGDLDGVSQGEMTHGTEPATGAMVYVALERFSGRLAGKTGTFLLAHVATMMRSDLNSGTMSITVVPNSGTGEFAGLLGTLQIAIDSKGVHSYDLSYTLTSAR